MNGLEYYISRSSKNQPQYRDWVVDIVLVPQSLDSLWPWVSLPGRTMRRGLLQTGARVVSLFSGCGGLDLGFEAAGFQSNTMLEWAPYATATLRENFPNAKVIGPPIYSGDITDPQAVEQLPLSGIDLLIGGPPCQSFSIAAAQRFLKGDKKFKRTGFKDRQRGGLIYNYLRVLSEMKPRIFVIENVPGLKELDNGRELRDIIDICRNLGYAVADPTILQAADYGVPQFRQRLLIIGARGKKTPKLPTPTHTSSRTLFADQRADYVTVSQALIGISRTAKNHIVRQHNQTSVERYRRLEVGQRERLGRVDRLDPERPSKTVIAGGMNGGGRSHLHPFLARTLTVRECARLQTFPDNFEFLGNTSRQFTQAGNAVPPLLAENLARSIGQQFFGLQYGDELTFRANPEGWTVRDAIRDLLRQARREKDYLYRDLIAS